jgi:hypothetical protein
METINILRAKYINDYKIEIFFNDKSNKVIDFYLFLSKNSHPQYDKYKELKNFRKFKIENGNIVWGKNWDLVFPVFDLYNGTF